MTPIVRAGPTLYGAPGERASLVVVQVDLVLHHDKAALHL
jgi:hypothetical protein